MPRYNKDYYGGALIILIGVGAVLGGVQYGIGALTHMGSGFFPAAVGVILVACGLAIALGAGPPSVDREKPRPFEWRGRGCIIGGLVAFIVLAAYGGALLATFAIVFIAALGDRKNTVTQALILATVMVVINVVVFWWALQVQLPLFNWG
ncbi:MAG TPA: tripartite tricarboxylate transporter TctB family protein [Candidatus Binataceae bacterium]|nr:tripartite tricarboxylate transporter TctB family protein [Candidatus Binataceae bacterium]